MSAFRPLWPILEPIIASANGGSLPRPNSSGWITGLRSPLRQDEHPGSFSVKPDSETEPGGFRDFAIGHEDKGSLAELARRLGIDPQSSSNGHKPSRWERIARYTYHDAAGNVAYLVDRELTERGKTFVQRRPDGSPGVEGIERVPYHLPELLKARGTVYVVEGEKDADRLRALGKVATTNAGGAGWRWPEEWARYFEGLARVVIIPDNDSPGIRHARQIASVLYSHVPDIRLMEPLPGVGEKGDVSDWLDQGHTIEEIITLASRTPRLGAPPEIALEPANDQNEERRTPPLQSVRSAADLLRSELPEARVVVEGLLPEGATLLAGKPKIGKSWLALSLALAKAMGGEFLGHSLSEPGDVLYLALEDTDRRLQGRLRKLLGSDVRGYHAVAQMPERLHYTTRWARLDQGGLGDLGAWLQAHPQTSLVIVDTLKRIRAEYRGRGSAYDADYEAVMGLQQLAAEYSVAILILHHLRKQDSEDPLDLISGSLGLSGGVDNAWVIKRERGQSDAVLHVIGRDVEDAELALKFDAQEALWSAMGDAEDYRMSRERLEVMEVLRHSSEPLAPSEVAGMLGKSPGAVKKLMYLMSKDGLIRTARYGHYTVIGDSIRGNSGNSSDESESNSRHGAGLEGSQELPTSVPSGNSSVTLELAPNPRQDNGLRPEPKARVTGVTVDTTPDQDHPLSRGARRWYEETSDDD